MHLFAIADTHLSFGTGKPMDIFPGWSEHIPRLEKNWNAVVSPDDTVVVAGDVSWAMSFEQAIPDFAFLHALNGQKIILKGNHDYWWSTRKKMEEFLSLNGFTSVNILHNNAIETCGVCVCGSRGWFFDAEDEADRKVLLREAGRLDTSISQAEKTGLEPVVFLHYPPADMNRVCPEIYGVLTAHKTKRCYYGHMHGRAARGAFNGVRDGVRFTLISADYRDFTPLKIE